MKIERMKGKKRLVKEMKGDTNAKSERMGNEIVRVRTEDIVCEDEKEKEPKHE